MRNRHTAFTPQFRVREYSLAMLKHSLPWLACAVAAMLASYVGADLRLLAAALCGIAVMAHVKT